MIQFDYLLERDEADEVKQFKPDEIPTKLPNLVYIEAPNSSGKSTLLNILALGFHGLKKDNMNAALKNKMNALVNSSHQKLSFSFQITNEDGSLELTSKRESPDGEIIVRETIDGKTNLLTPDTFHRQYNLIYDVPDNPTERLNQLVYEIRDIQKMYGNHLGAFRNYILEITNAVQRGRDPKRVEQLNGLIDAGTSELSTMNQTREADETFLETLEKYYYVRMLDRKLQELANYEREISQLEAKIKKGMGKIKRMNKRYQGELEKTRSFLGDMKERQKQIGSLIESYLPKEERHHLDIWSRIDIDRGLEDYELTNTLDTEIVALQRVLMKQYIPDQDRKYLAEAKVYSELIDFLTAYRNSDVVLPGDRTIDEFIAQLEESNKQYRDLTVKAENFNKVISLLNRQREDRWAANKMLADLLKLKGESSLGEDDIIDEEDDRELERLKSKWDAVEQTVRDYIRECAKWNIGIDNVSEVIGDLKSGEALTPYLVYDDVQLGDAVNEKRSEIIALQTNIRSKSDNVRLHRIELARLEKLEPHKYQDRLEDLEKLLEIVMPLEQKLSKDYEANIKSIIDKSVNRGKKDDGYYDAVARYLGRRVGYVRHLDESLEVSKVDLIEGVIATKTGKKIRLTDMGTGQSQSAYLTGLLNTDDRRRIIAIFDEVAMMDVASLEPIYNKFRELYQKDRLLMGIVVQKGETTKVISKLEA